MNLTFLWGEKRVKGVASQRDAYTKRNYQTTSKSRLVMECAPQKDNMPRKMRKLSVLRLGSMMSLMMMIDDAPYQCKITVIGIEMSHLSWDFL